MGAILSNLDYAHHYMMRGTDIGRHEMITGEYVPFLDRSYSMRGGEFEWNLLGFLLSLVGHAFFIINARLRQYRAALMYERERMFYEYADAFGSVLGFRYNPNARLDQIP